MKRQTSETLVSGLDGGEDIGVRVGMLIPASVQHLDKQCELVDVDISVLSETWKGQVRGGTLVGVRKHYLSSATDRPTLPCPVQAEGRYIVRLGPSQRVAIGHSMVVAVMVFGLRGKLGM